MRQTATVKTFVALAVSALVSGSSEPAHARGFVIKRVIKRVVKAKAVRAALLGKKKPSHQLALHSRRAVGWGSGESQTYDVRIAGIEAARAALSVGKPKRTRGRWTIALRAIGETVPFISALYKMSEHSVTLASLEGLRPLRTKEHRVMRKKLRKMSTRHGALNLQVIERNNRRIERRKRRFRGPHFDSVTALYVLRSLPLRQGKKLRMLVLAGTALYDVRLTVRKKERVRSKLGANLCHRIDGSARRILDDGRVYPRKPLRRFSLWLTADRARVPIKAKGDTDIGYVEAAISSHQPPKRRLALRAPRL